MYAGVTNDATLPLTKGLERGFDEIQAIPTLGEGWKNGYLSLLPTSADGRPTFLFLHTYWTHLPYLAGFGPRRFPSGDIPGLPVTDGEFYASSSVFYRFAADALRQDASQLSFDNLVVRPDEYLSVADAIDRAVAGGDPKQMKQAIDRTNTYSLYMRWYLRFIDPQNPTHMAVMKALYDEQIYALDAALLPLMRYVDRPDQKRRTILIITSDHGEEFMEHGAFGHDQNIYDTTTHVPLIASIPRVRNGRYDEVVQSIDLYPTLLALVGIRTGPPVQGKSLLPILFGTSLGADGYAISELTGNRMQSIRNREWKFYRGREKSGGSVAKRSLFHTSSDPLEMQDVIGQYPEVAKSLESELDRRLSAGPRYDPVPAVLPSWMSPGDRQKLMDRGYF